MSRERNVAVILHVGPHKTASSSIQALLASQRDTLASLGVFVPDGVSGEYPGHHMVPFALRNHDMAKLGGAAVEDLPRLLASWLESAWAARCSRLVLSAEDFSVLTDEQWRQLTEDLAVAQRIADIHINSLDVCVTDRDLEARVRSTARELVKGGASDSAEVLESLLRADTAQHDRAIVEFTTLLPMPTRVIRTPFEGEDLVKRWCDTNLGAEISEHIPRDAFGRRINEMLSENTIEQLREFNRLNAPSAGVNPLSPFSVMSNDEERLAFERLKMFRWVLAERDRYYTEMNQLAYRLTELGEKWEY
jgi:hypothetical protein